MIFVHQYTPNCGSHAYINDGGIYHRYTVFGFVFGKLFTDDGSLYRNFSQLFFVVGLFEQCGHHMTRWPVADMKPQIFRLRHGNQIHVFLGMLPYPKFHILTNRFNVMSDITHDQEDSCTKWRIFMLHLYSYNTIFSIFI